jgi:phenylalanyl-tRNA synthetase alpha chain
MKQDSNQSDISAGQVIRMLLSLDEETVQSIESSNDSYEVLLSTYLGKESEFTRLSGQIRLVKKEDRQQLGSVINGVKLHIEQALEKKHGVKKTDVSPYLDTTEPGERPPDGHLHIVSQAIEEITEIFSRIGFSRVRHPEVDWDYYAFEALNMPKNHPARDEWETFFIDTQKTENKEQRTENRFNKMVLTPHTSNGQVREMEKGRLPIRMINIAKCYRRQIDVSHTPMFHQFEGLYIDKNVSIGHLKGVLDYFAKQFFGPGRTTRIRPFHFQFTEPSFEVDISCGICLGKGKLTNGSPCKLCKEGWLEMGGAGMVHPNVMKFGGVNTDEYSGFAFGWGVERAYMMKGDTQLDDIRILYGNDIRFLKQF